jgi:hypothetical protein
MGASYQFFLQSPTIICVLIQAYLIWCNIQGVPVSLEIFLSSKPNENERRNPGATVPLNHNGKYVYKNTVRDKNS